MNLERRNNLDRRASPTPPISKYIFKGRRRRARRRGEDRNYYVDRYDSRYLLIIGLTLVLCIFDAALTLSLMHHGGREINPFMLLLMNEDIILALAVKYLITVASMIFFLLHKNFRAFGKLRINSLLYGVLGVYLALVVLEVSWYVSMVRVMKASP